MPIIPYVWSGLSRETRRQIVLDEQSNGNTVVWVRLTVIDNRPALDVVDIQGASLTQQCGVVTVQNDFSLEATHLPHWCVPYPLAPGMDQFPDPLRPYTRLSRVRVSGLDPVPTQEPRLTVNPTEVSDKLRRLIEIDIRGISPQPVSVEASQPTL